jgi:glutamine amidotransferase
MIKGDIVVVDYHKGNLQSVVRGVSAAGGSAFASDRPEDIAASQAVILPGVGSFEEAMVALKQTGQADAIVEAIGAGKPFLGICLGLHVLFSRGTEHAQNSSFGGTWVPGLGILRGSVTRLESTTLKVPHVGWDQAYLTERGRQSPLFVDVPDGANLYFTHSYALADDVADDVVATRTHYVRSFASGVWRDNVFGVQFHPEKSSRVGMQILQNFVNVARG